MGGKSDSILSALSDFFKAKSLDLFFVTQKENIRFLTQFSGSFGVVAISNTGQIQLFTDARYLVAAKKELSVPVFDIAELKNVLSEGKTIGFEAENMTISRLANLKKRFPKTTWKKSIGVIEALRREKSDEEVKKLQLAAEISKRAIEKTLPQITLGMTEKEVAWIFEKTARELGADRISFPTVVAFGENSATPHHETSDRKLKKNETVLIDFGVKKNGYCSDCTRTYFSGKPTTEFLRVWNLVFSAQQLGISLVKAGKKVAEIDTAVRSYFGEEQSAFCHSLGHGVGLQIHEAPSMSEKSKEELITGDCITIEPGLYFEEKFGIRIEDFGIVTKKSFDLLPAVKYGEKELILPAFR